MYVFDPKLSFWTTLYINTLYVFKIFLFWTSKYTYVNGTQALYIFRYVGRSNTFKVAQSTETLRTITFDTLEIVGMSNGVKDILYIMK